MKLNPSLINRLYTIQNILFMGGFGGQTAWILVVLLQYNPIMIVWGALASVMLILGFCLKLFLDKFVEKKRLKVVKHKEIIDEDEGDSEE